MPQASQSARRGRAALAVVPPGWTATAETILVRGQSRSYLVVRPGPVAGASLPVLVVLPGRGMTPAGIEGVTHFAGVTGRAILVFPAGYQRSWNAGACCGAAHAAGVDDVAFLTALVRHVDALPGAAAHQVYLVGYSNGGRMAYRMACRDPGAFAGVAAVEAVPVATCPRADPVPVMIVASRNDPLLSVGPGQPGRSVEGYPEPTVAGTVRAWRLLDGCGPAATNRSQGRLTVTTWGDCTGGARVAVAVYQGGSHAWPQGSSATPPAQAVVWRFLRG
jgi:polyhydroxybutyrate depolymerase